MYPHQLSRGFTVGNAECHRHNRYYLVNVVSFVGKPTGLGFTLLDSAPVRKHSELSHYTNQRISLDSRGSQGALVIPSDQFRKKALGNPIRLLQPYALRVITLQVFFIEFWSIWKFGQRPSVP